MHEHFSRTVVAFDLAVDADGTVAFQTEQLQFYGGVEEAITDDLRFLSQLSPLVFALQAILMVALIARNAQIGILGLAVLPGDVILAKLTRDFLR